MQGQLLLIGFGAGLASALLYAAVASGSPFAVVLLYVAPLPILIAGVGWRHHAGLLAAAIGMLTLAFTIGPKTGFYYAAVVGLPSWWLAYLALLARETPNGAEWYPVGRLVVWCAGLGAGLVAASIPFVATDLAGYQAALKEVFSAAFNASDGTPPPGLPEGVRMEDVVDLMAKLAPGVAATFWTISSIVNVWLAGRIVRASNRLVRPWPDLRRIEYPKRTPLALLAGLAGSFLPDVAGLVAELFAATFLIAFALLGLATIHVATLGSPARGLVLFGTYALLFIVPWIAVFLASLGLAEQLFGIRRRFGPPPSTPPPAAPA